MYDETTATDRSWTSWVLVAVLAAALAAAGCAGTGTPAPTTAPGATPPATAAAAGPGTEDLPEEVDEEEGEEEFAEFAQTNGAPYALLGTLLLPDRVVEAGGLLVEDGVIQAVWEGEPPAEAAGVTAIETGGIILPGLIDLHNHVAYNFLPFWHAGRLFENRYEWQKNSAYKKAVSQPYNAAKKRDPGPDLLDEMVKWGEIRGLVGGTTSILGAASTAGAGILARNIDQRTRGRDLMRTNVGAVVEFGCSRGKPECPEQAAALDRLRATFDDASVRAMVFHVAEGVDESSREEFDWLRRNDLLLPQVVVTHGTAFTATELGEMAAADMPLIWSPRSNIELYGKTADVAAARAAGVRIALAPDWSPSGSDNLLGELRYAAAYNHAMLGDLFSAQELVAMATSVPAEIAGRGDELGRLEEGFVADLLVLARVGPDAYRSVVASDERQVMLVTVNGVALYGWPDWLAEIADGEIETVSVRGVTRAIVTTVPAEFGFPKGDQTFAALHGLLAAAYETFGELPELTANGP